MRLRLGLLLLTIVALVLWNLRFGPYRLTRMTQNAAREAVERAQSEYQVELDFSEASIAKVEEVAGRARAGGALNEAGRAELAKLLGVYLGEVARRHHGGQWIIPKEGPFQGALVLQSKRGMTSPPSKVYKRLVDGEGDNLAAYYQVLTRPAVAVP